MQSTCCGAAFEGVKTALTDALVLAFTDLTCPVKIIIDAYGVGLGTVQVQESKCSAYTRVSAWYCVH